MKHSKQPLRLIFFSFLLICLLTGLAGILHAPEQAKAAPYFQFANNVVISEVRTRGSGGSTDEFIEIYNPSLSTSVNLNGWKVNISNNLGTTSTIYTFPTNVTLQGSQHYLIANVGYNDSVNADVTFSTDIPDNGGVAIVQPNNSISDAVGFDGGSAYRESFTLLPLNTDTDQGYERRLGGVNGSCQDNNVNTYDFSLINPSDPQNSVSPILACALPLPTPQPGNVIISEVAWSGTTASPNAEWIELHNLTDNPIYLNNTILRNSANTVNITLTGTLNPYGYFLLESGNDSSINDVVADQIYTGSLADTNDSLTLTANGITVDTANSDGGTWPAGTVFPNSNSMERRMSGSTVFPDNATGWISNANSATWTKHAANGDLIKGTPGYDNWAYSVTPTSSPTNTSTPASNLNILISEVAWSGTQANSAHEWIELFNPGPSSVDISGWRLIGAGNTPSITINNNVTLPVGGFYLLARNPPTGFPSIFSDVTPNQTFTGDLTNTGETLWLYTGSNVLVDTANSDSGDWPAGTDGTGTPSYSSMERLGRIQDGPFAWFTNPGTIIVAHDYQGNNIHGTPGRANYAFTITLTPTLTPTLTRTPTVTRTPTLVRSRTPTKKRTSTRVPTLAPQPLVAISEFVPRPGHDWNNDGKINTDDEYIELINHGVIDVNLSNYRLDDEANIGSDPFTLPAITIKPGERIVFYGSQTGLRLSDGGDGVRLLKLNGQLVDAFNYFTVGYPDQAYCRLPDDGGADDWNNSCYPTPGLRNSRGSFGTVNSTPIPESVCPFTDTAPQDFVYAECDPFGNNIFRPSYWDDPGWLNAQDLPNTNEKDELFAD